MTKNLSALPRGARTILVVDDSNDVRELLRMHLADAGYEVLTAEDAVEAGRVILRGAPDLMIVDVNMPYMDGFELVATLLADTTIPLFPVMFLTSRDDAEDRAELLGAVACLRKPVLADRLLRTVARHIDGFQHPRRVNAKADADAGRSALALSLP
jgi:two-component system chemotaxis response regulator CheY